MPVRVAVVTERGVARRYGKAGGEVRILEKLLEALRVAEEGNDPAIRHRACQVVRLVDLDAVDTRGEQAASPVECRHLSLASRDPGAADAAEDLDAMLLSQSDVGQHVVAALVAAFVQGIELQLVDEVQRSTSSPSAML